MTVDDRRLDAALRQVPLPDSVEDGLTRESLFEDAAIDALLARVPASPDLGPRIREAINSGPARPRSGAVDLARLAPSRPRQFALERVADRSRSKRSTAVFRESLRVAMAVAVAFAVTLTGIGFSRWLEGRPQSPGSVATRLQPPEARPREPVAAAPDSSRLPASGVSIPARAGGTPPASDIPETAASGKPEAFFAPELNDSRRLAVDDRRQADAATIRGAPIRPLSGSRLPMTMRTVELPGEVRRAVPRSPAFDLAFEMAQGQSPFVSPAADPLLAIDQPPLTLRTDDFALLGSGALVRQREPLRAEQILAALPPPEPLTVAGEPLRLGMHVVRSWRDMRGRPSLLLEVVAHAVGGGPVPERSAVRPICLVLDQSAAGDRLAWPRICRGLTAVAGQLSPTDRVTLILCGPRPRVALERAAPGRLAALATDLEWLPATSSADLDAGLQLAQAVADGSRTIVVSHDGTLERGRETVRAALTGWHRHRAEVGGDSLEASSDGGPRFIILDPAAPRRGRAGDPTFGRTGLDSVSIRRAMIREVLQRETTVAADCRLEVRFDPGAVAGYRLLGHRQSAVESLSTTQPEAIDLHVGETARVVYEVIPRRSLDEPLATAILHWRPPAGAARAVTTRDPGSQPDRGATTPSPHGCELLLASILGETLGASPHVAQRGPPLAVAAGVSTAWKDRGDVTPFGATLIRCLESRRTWTHHRD